jgi:hypothetical protein
MHETKDISTKPLSLAHKLDAEVRAGMAQVQRIGWRIANLCRQMRDERLYLELGFDGLEAWIDSVAGMSRAGVYKYMALIESLPHIPVSELDKISCTNAEALLHLPEAKQKDSAWIEKAQTLSPKEMRDAVNATPGALPIETCYLKITFETYDQRKVFLDWLTELKEEMGIENTAAALEKYVAELSA